MDKDAGFIVIARKLLKHPVVGIANPQRFAAWLWMLSEAQWRAGRITVEGHGFIELARGELCASYRHIEDKTGMSKAAFGRFKTRLETGTGDGPMIGTRVIRLGGTPRLIISICNYDKYQNISANTGTPPETVPGTPSENPTGTDPGRTRDKEEYKEPFNQDSLSNNNDRERDRARVLDPPPSESVVVPGGFVTDLISVCEPTAERWGTVGVMNWVMARLADGWTCNQILDAARAGRQSLGAAAMQSIGYVAGVLEKQTTAKAPPPPPEDQAARVRRVLSGG
ncbi:MAG: hypothetical protein AAGI03_00685 [Pseudomonadota bacterium]